MRMKIFNIRDAEVVDGMFESGYFDWSLELLKERSSEQLGPERGIRSAIAPDVGDGFPLWNPRLKKDIDYNVVWRAFYPPTDVGGDTSFDTIALFVHSREDAINIDWRDK